MWRVKGEDKQSKFLKTLVLPSKFGKWLKPLGQKVFPKVFISREGLREIVWNSILNFEMGDLYAFVVFRRNRSSEWDERRNRRWRVEGKGKKWKQSRRRQNEWRPQWLTKDKRSFISDEIWEARRDFEILILCGLIEDRTKHVSNFTRIFFGMKESLGP